MGIIRKIERLEKQINVKVSEDIYNKYKAVKETCAARGWEFSLHPEFSEWLTGVLGKAEKELAKKAPAVEAVE